MEIIVSNEMAADIIVNNDNLHCHVSLSSVTHSDIDQAHTSYQNFTGSHLARPAPPPTGNIRLEILV